MATTDIHPITSTVGLALQYVTNDKVESVLKDDVADSINYAMNDKTGEVTYKTITSTMNCMDREKPIETFKKTMERFGEKELREGNSKTKDGKAILAWHLVQSFEGQYDPTVINQIGYELAKELFLNFPVVISTHTNTENTHNHIMICAWNMEGKKYNYDHAAYQRIREVSDELCLKYGFSVLEETRTRKLIQWKDEDGQTHYYEPTDRKNRIIEQRRSGEIENADVNSYVNTIPYDIDISKKQSNVETVKRAIDNFLPYATSYEHLLSMLRESGFAVKDKKKSGEWLSHVSFQPPTASKAVRDSSIDKENNFYCRENLTKVIEKNNEERSHHAEEQDISKIPYYQSYVYGEIDVQNIDMDFRIAVDEATGEVKAEKRGEIEKAIISDVKVKDGILRQKYDTTTLNNLIAREQEERKRKVPPKAKENLLVRQIQDSFENLTFIENRQIYSYEQINSIVSELWGQYNLCLSKLEDAEGMIQQLDYISSVPKLLAETRGRMQKNKDNSEYLIEEYPADAKVLKRCIELMKKHNLTDSESLSDLRTSIAKHKEQTEKLQGMLNKFSQELAAYNRCVQTLQRIDREYGGMNDLTFDDYRRITTTAEQKAEQTNTSRRRKGYER